MRKERFGWRGVVKEGLLAMRGEEGLVTVPNTVEEATEAAVGNNGRRPQLLLQGLGIMPAPEKIPGRRQA